MSQVGVDTSNQIFIETVSSSGPQEDKLSSVFYKKKAKKKKKKKSEKCCPFNHVTPFRSTLLRLTGATLKSLQTGFHTTVKWSETKNGFLFKKKKKI